MWKNKRMYWSLIAAIVCIAGFLGYQSANAITSTYTQPLYDSHDVVATADAVTNAYSRDVIGNKTDAAAAGAVSATESLMAYAKQAITQQEQTITATTAFTASTDVMFTVAGGAIRITSLFGQCTTVAGGSPGTMTIEVDATAGASYDSDLSTTVNVDALGEGDTICFTNAISEGVLTLTANVGAGQSLSWFADIGDIEQTLSSTGTGAVIWYMTYIPLETGVTVTAP